ncbi:MAG: SagB/ThcOx family dehydrogenase [Desulfobacterales bacterium]
MTSSHPTHLQTVVAYHDRTKHHYHRMARSSGFMDWANQPAPFRRYAGTDEAVLPLAASDPELEYSALFAAPGTTAAPLNKAGLAAFLELSLGLSAWKAIGDDRWALRINPSSGNLHPTEAYLLTARLDDLADGLFHYNPEAHALERRIALPAAAGEMLAAHLESPGFFVALSSVVWREAWKYGERGFRYCQHDVGHALAALSFAARLQGWRIQALAGVGEDGLERLLGFDRTRWHPLEEETPEVILQVNPSTAPRPKRTLPPEVIDAVAAAPIRGHPNQLSPVRRRWDIIHAVAAATRQMAVDGGSGGPSALVPAPEGPPGIKAAEVIRRRRSAVAFDPNGRMDRDTFLQLIARTLPAPECPPFDIDGDRPRISLLLFVHQVVGLPPGMYMFIRHPPHHDDLRSKCDPALAWQPAAGDLPLYRLREGDCRMIAADLACRQEIAGASVFALAMLAAFESTLRDAPWRYRRLFWEAGQIGQVLYLEAEARGYRGTGIGCYFDDPVHDLIGIDGHDWQDLYHFTVGLPFEDPRLQTFPPYAHLSNANRA